MMIWWEKTIEYKYILRYAEPETFALPFDGNHEKLGDAIFGSSDKWTLIEFKRSADELDSEKAKFADYERAKRKLQDRDSCHFLIYGEPTGGQLKLKARTYFSRNNVDINDVKLIGTKSAGEFTNYLRDLYQEKLKNGSSTGGVEMGHVMGVQSNGLASRMVSVSDYLEAAKECELAYKIRKSKKHIIGSTNIVKRGGP